MIHFWFILALISSYSMYLQGMNNQITSSGSAGAAVSAPNHKSKSLAENKRKKIDRSPGLLISASPEGPEMHAATLTSEQKAKIEHINNQLKLLKSDANWKARKEIIKKAVEEGIHPDLLNSYHETPLLSAAWELDGDSDKEFIRFLLKHGANPKQERVDGSNGPALARVKNPAIAQLFFDHGAHDVVQNRGAELLQSTIYTNNAHIPMITWYIAHGADVNGVHEGKTPLCAIVFHCNGYLDNQSSHLQAAQLLVQAGALLSVRMSPDSSMHNYTIPQIMKARLEEIRAEDSNEIQRTQLNLLMSIRTFLIIASNRRHQELQQNILSATNLIPEIAMIIKHYCIEPTYEALEAEPYPAIK